MILENIIKEKTYLKDYKDITEKVLYDNNTYEKVITAIDKIIASGVFN